MEKGTEIRRKSECQKKIRNRFKIQKVSDFSEDLATLVLNEIFSHSEKLFIVILIIKVRVNINSVKADKNHSLTFDCLQSFFFFI